MRLVPQTSGAGITFIRTDLADQPEAARCLSARYDHVVDTRLSTTIGNRQGVTISTIEHLMAALAGCGVDDVAVEIDGAEVPIMDGSSQPFVDAIRQAGIVSNGKDRHYLRVLKLVEVRSDDGWARLSPADGFEIDVVIDFPNRAIGRQRWRAQDFSRDDHDFDTELAGARTFGFVDDFDSLRQIGLAQGASLENTIAIKKHADDQLQGTILNRHMLRYQDEFVRHKALDALGDLALAGAPLIGRFESYKGGHRLNNELLCALFADKSCYMIEHGI